MNEHAQFATQEAEHSSDRSATLFPPVDIFEDDAGITLTVDLPGVSKEHLGVKVNGDNLVIEGGASIPAPQGMELLYAEIRGSYYHRSFTLSRELNATKIEANLKDGVLKLRIPKAEEAKPRQIQVKIG